MEIQPLDIAAVAIVAAATLRGLFIGLVREGFSLASLAAAYMAVQLFTHPAADWLQETTKYEVGPGIAPWVAGAGIAIGTVTVAHQAEDALDGPGPRQLLLVTVDGDDAGSGPMQTLGGGSADPARGSRHDRDPSLVLRHLDPSPGAPFPDQLRPLPPRRLRPPSGGPLPAGRRARCNAPVLPRPGGELEGPGRRSPSRRKIPRSPHFRSRACCRKVLQRGAAEVQPPGHLALAEGEIEMQRPSARRIRLALATSLLASWASLASAEEVDLYYAGAGGGAFVPWSGETSWTVMGEFGTDWSSPHVRVGGEFVFTDSSKQASLGFANPVGADVGIRTYQLNFVTRYVMFPGRFTPYIGVGGGFSVIDVDDASFKALLNPALPPAAAALLARGNSSVGIGGGVLGLVGLELPVGSQNVNLFAEGRASYIWELTSGLEPVASPENFSGFTGAVGIRLRW